MINRIQKNFIWGTTPTKKKMHLTGRETVIKPKIKGGLGIQKVECKSKALHDGLAWRIFHKPTSLWARVLIFKHCNLTHIPKKSKSPIWQYILQSWNTCKAASKWFFHEGAIVNFLNYICIPNNISIRSMVEGPFNPTDHSVKVANVYNNSNRNTSSLSTSLPANVTNTLKSTFITNASSKEDKIMWGLTRIGIFNTKSPYHLIDSKTPSTTATSKKNFSWIWTLKVPNKIKSFFWVLHHERLPIGAFLHQIGVNIGPICISTLTILKPLPISSFISQMLSFSGIVQANLAQRSVATMIS